MNFNKEIILTHWKTNIQWLVIISFLSMAFTFNACNKEINSDSREKYPSLKVANQNTDNRTIISVELVGYDFKNLSIPVGSSQTFTLDKGMPGGYEDINIKVSFDHYTTTASVSNKVNFTDGKITTVTLKGCVSFEGCDGFYLEYKP